MSPTQTLAAGLRALPGGGANFASTQAAWRFYANPDTDLPTLAKPLLECGRQLLQQLLCQYGLVALDWSDLAYTHHQSKPEQMSLGQGTGYELATALLISDRNGAPLAPLNISLQTAQGRYTTDSPTVQPRQSCQDQTTTIMGELASQDWGVPLVYIIDRVADSARHLRQWTHDQHRFVVRASEGRRVVWQGQSELLREVAQQVELRPSQAVELSASVVGELLVGQTTITITGRDRWEPSHGRRISRVAAPLSLRLIVCQVRLPDEGIAAQWCLVSNLEEEVSAAVIAEWYYWRWRIESFFKLLKGAGLNLEQWQQETPLALSKRLCVAAMACVVVWQLQTQTGEAGEQARQLLVRLSGRQVRRGQATAPALLAGLWNLLAMLETLAHYDLDELKQAAQMALPGYFYSGDP